MGFRSKSAEATDATPAKVARDIYSVLYVRRADDTVSLLERVNGRIVTDRQLTYEEAESFERMYAGKVAALPKDGE